jgi:Ca2+-binding EF-hand superfamily protein
MQESEVSWTHKLAVSMIGCTVAFATTGAGARTSQRTVLQMLDPDNDGTIDLNEAKAAASALFDQLDPDHDGTLDRKELKGRMTGSAFRKADPDNDGTIDKNEYLAVVEARFKAANPDQDGTIDAKELKTPAGRALLRLLVK